MNLIDTRHVVVAIAIVTISFPLFGQTKEKKDHSKTENEVVVLSPFCVNTGGFGATPGGAQDINFFRMGSRAGQIPHPNTITAEGLFSEHDLPLELGRRPTDIINVQSAATDAQFQLLPEARYLAQLGFSSNLDPRTWHRAPLNFIAVVDKSGSMSGQPLALVRESLHHALQHLENGDQMSIVLYGDRAHVHLPTTRVGPGTRDRINEQIDTIESAGSTSMEAGLQLGYQVARESAAGFKGTTRLMLFTDERPNVGNTDADSFMAMARAGSQEGIGLTTIGVGEQFGAELATTISSVRGSNLFFFSNADEMTKTFSSDFDTMVTELAHELSIRIEPAAGLRLDGVFGVPANLLHWDGRSIVLDVATIFLSKRKGAIYFALAPDQSRSDLPAARSNADDTVATIHYEYTDLAGHHTVSHDTSCMLLATDKVQAGLRRGVALVDEYVTLKKAAQVHLLENDQETAFRLVSGLWSRLSANHDRDLVSEQKLVCDLNNTLALLSGHAGEIRLPNAHGAQSPLIGAWRQTNNTEPDCKGFVVVWPNGVIETIQHFSNSETADLRDTLALKGEVPAAGHGKLRISEEDRARFSSVLYQVTDNQMTLTVNGRGSKNETLEFVRCAYAEIPAGSKAANEPQAIDPISGLPSRRGSPKDTQTVNSATD